MPAPIERNLRQIAALLLEIADTLQPEAEQETKRSRQMRQPKIKDQFRNREKWTPADENLLLQLAQLNTPYSAIARTVGRTEKAVAERLRKLERGIFVTFD